MITISDERYKELIQMEAKLELLIRMYRRNKHFNWDVFMDLFDPEYKEEEKA